MKRNRKSLDVDPSYGLAEDEIKKGAKGYTDWHWGYGPRRVVDVEDDDIPAKHMIQCGRLIRMHIRVPRDARSAHPRRRTDAMIEFSHSVGGSHIAYDPDHQHERLYLIVPPSQRKTFKKHFWTDNPMPARDLNELAAIAGGKHGRKTDYPHIQCKPLGILTAVVYNTAKKGDSPEYGSSHYIHHVGELSRYYPFLCVDAKGRLWLAGGNYTSPNPGITD